MKTTIVTTTINVPTFLTAYAENAKRFARDVDFVVVGDKKTKFGAAEFCKSIPNCVYLDVEDQRQYMSRYPKLAAHLPYNSAERRNIGILWAYERGVNILITLDDDNLATTHDAVGSHQIVETKPLLTTLGSSSGWANVCVSLKEKNDVEFYHRGYSPRHRWDENSFVTAQQERNTVVVNAGFWLDDPDVDAITRLERKPQVTGYRPGFPGTIALAPGTWSPFNCQNTAIARHLIPAYFLSPHIGRHADIFASYVINRLTQHFGDVIAFGNPLVLHKRQPHNLMHDFELEKEGIQLTDSFCDALRAIPLSATTYHEGFGEIIIGLTGWGHIMRQEKIIEGMALWHEVFTEIR